VTTERITERLAAWVAGLDVRAQARGVRRETAERLLDTLGGALAAVREPSARIAADEALESGGREEAVVLGRGARVPAAAAALANGIAAHSLELDDYHHRSVSHPAVAVVPAALAAAERAGAHGATLLSAVLAGYEVACRVGSVMPSGSVHSRGFHATGLWGTFGAAAAAARAMGLDAAGTARALGIAGSTPGGLFEFIHEGAWTKRFHGGWAAHAGVMAAALAARGYTAPATVLEGRYGFFRAFFGDAAADLAAVTEGLGERFEILNGTYKFHACCGYCHTPIDGALAVARRERLAPAAIERIEVGLFDEGLRIVGGQAPAKYRPRTPVDAQFSVPYSVAVALVRGRALVDEFALEALDDPAVLGLAERVATVPDPDMQAIYPRYYAARVSVFTKDGRRVDEVVKSPRGSPESRATTEDVVAKFRAVTARILAEDRASAVVEAVDRLESSPSVRPLTDLLRGRDA
jgi:2-methylcitrate dehydratase PrpD